MIKSDFHQEMPDQPGRVHFVGIGGAGMSGIAHQFLDAGLSVSGSDVSGSDIVEKLRGRGVTITIGHDAAAVGRADTVVVTGAIAEDNPEFLEAKSRGIPIVHRAVALAWLTRGRRLVAVAGAHGKTTSTAMIVTALRELGADPSFVNGGVIRSLGVSAASGTGPLFVVEADESDGSFLLYDTAVSLITNVDPDHLDHFGTPEAFADAFVAFARKAREAVVISADDVGARKLTPLLTGQKVVTFGTSAGAMVRVHSISSGPTASFELTWQGREFSATLRVPGEHNAWNAAGAFAVLVTVGWGPEESLAALSAFEGTARRFEFRGEVRGVRVFDDFAHHPTEISAALSGARSVVGGGRVIPLFQPHLYSRTRQRSAEFASVFEELADYTIVVPIYGAREVPEPGVSGQLIVDDFRDSSLATYASTWEEAIDLAVTMAKPGDILVPMGGGDVYRLIPDLLAALDGGS